MYHVRLLKVPYIAPPPAKQQFTKKGPGANDGSSTKKFMIAATTTLTTELGEYYFYGTATVRASIFLKWEESVRRRKKHKLKKDESDKDVPVASGTWEWRPGMRALKMSLSLQTRAIRENSHEGRGPKFILRVEVVDDEHLVDENVLYEDEHGGPWKPRFLTIESMPFAIICADITQPLNAKVAFDREDALYVVRHAEIAGDDYTFCEEIGDSMAKHLWDSGLLLGDFLSASQDNKAVFVSQLLRDSRPLLRILELGCGCGTAGLILSRQFTASTVLLTDLESAADVCRLNIAVNPRQTSAHGTIEFSQFDWVLEHNTPTQLSRVTDTVWDVVVVCDCTYNTDSFDALTDVLLKTVDKKHGTRVVLVHKERHGSENRVFEMLKQKNALEVRWRQELGPSGMQARVDVLE
ncbi:putative methyltransferase-domain-containing protein [Limtongia smithiae]|uniref:putative methyltransferase-domain-containing protein n=1 Tax=Limtongia smithiae TaxID=1125753 RepID=UPI0034CE3BD4